MQGLSLMNSALTGLRSGAVCVWFAFANLGKNKWRLAAGVAGAAVPILLLTLQIAFMQAVSEKVARLYDGFDFDLAVLSDGYQFLFDSGSFDRVRLLQARAVPGVAATYGLNIGTTRWADERTGKYSPVMLIGLDAPAGFVKNPSLRDGYSRLNSGRMVLVDAWSSPELGRVAPGTEAQLARQSIEVAGQFSLGMFFYADGSVALPNEYFSNYSGSDPGRISIGLIRVASGTSVAEVQSRLQSALPPDVRVVTRDELVRDEQAYFLTTKPIGIMIRIGMVVAFVVGSVILLQVLSAEIVNRTGEFATLKAMGYSAGFVLGVGASETAGIAGAAYALALAGGAGILAAVQSATHLSAALSPQLAATVFGIVISMCALAAFVVVRRIMRSDPAALY